LTDAACERIAPLLPGLDGRERPWRDHRQVVNGVLWRLRTGAPLEQLPQLIRHHTLHDPHDRRLPNNPNEMSSN
jgi:transposase